jgi:hypothetical protein
VDFEAVQHRQREVGLRRAHHADDGAHDARLGAIGRVVERDVLEEAAVARTAARPDGQRGADPAHGGRVDDRDACDEARVGGEELGGEVVAPLDDEVVAAGERDRVARQEPRAMQLHANARRRGRERARGRVELRRADVRVLEEDLPVQVRPLDDVVVAKTERADAGVRQREGGGAPEAPRADDEHARVPPAHARASLGKYSSRLK